MKYQPTPYHPILKLIWSTEHAFLLSYMCWFQISIQINDFPMGMSLETVVVLRILCVETVVVFIFIGNLTHKFPRKIFGTTSRSGVE